MNLNLKRKKQEADLKPKKKANTKRSAPESKEAKEPLKKKKKKTTVTAHLRLNLKGKKDAISEIRANPDFQNWLKEHNSNALSGLVDKLDVTEGAVLLEIIKSGAKAKPAAEPAKPALTDPDDKCKDSNADQASMAEKPKPAAEPAKPASTDPGDKCKDSNADQASTAENLNQQLKNLNQQLSLQNQQLSLQSQHQQTLMINIKTVMQTKLQRVKNLNQQLSIKFWILAKLNNNQKKKQKHQKSWKKEEKERKLMNLIRKKILL